MLGCEIIVGTLLIICMIVRLELSTKPNTAIETFAFKTP